MASGLECDHLDLLWKPFAISPAGGCGCGMCSQLEPVGVSSTSIGENCFSQTCVPQFAILPPGFCPLALCLAEVSLGTDVVSPRHRVVYM